MFGFRRWLKNRLVDFLTHPVSHYERRGHNDLDALKHHARKGDVLLVEGDQRVSQVIKYLTHSTWSHSALYIGDELLLRGGPLRDQAIEAFGGDARFLVVEALMDGVVAQPVSKYVDFNLRLCRPENLQPEHLKVVIDDSVAAIGWPYDMRNVTDLARYFVSVSLFPQRLRREAERFGSNAKTEVICSSLIGQLYQKVGFPVSPTITFPEGAPPAAPRRPGMMQRFFLRRGWEPTGIFHRRHPTLLTPRDFDLSPYFRVVKFNTIAGGGFDYELIQWAEDDLTAHQVTAEADPVTSQSSSEIEPESGSS